MTASPPPVVAIAAVARNGVIGSGADIPWHLPEDWRRFKRLTMGQPLIMGRKTFESIGRPLPGRRTLVVTRDTDWVSDGVEVATSVEQAIRAAARSEPPTIYVAGGGEIYRAAWPWLDGLEITEVDAIPEGDVTFPTIAPEEWIEIGRERGEQCVFVTYRRRTEKVTDSPAVHEVEAGRRH